MPVLAENLNFASGCYDEILFAFSTFMQIIIDYYQLSQIFKFNNSLVQCPLRCLSYGGFLCALFEIVPQVAEPIASHLNSVNSVLNPTGGKIFRRNPKEQKGRENEVGS